jgi:aminoglycoside phosphotransferase (APT) family kinase protein
VSAAAIDMSALPPEIPRALRDAFGGAPIDDVSAITGGRSGATLLSLTVGGAGYILRRADPARPAHDVRTPREIACMTIAAKGGVAPELRHVDAATGVSIMARIAIAPIARGSVRTARIARAARTLRRLHDGPAFPRGARANAIVRAFDESLRARGSGGLPAPLLATLDELAALTERFPEAACHNDLNPGNVLDTDDATYFVDWETAGAGDPFFDLAGIGVFKLHTPDERAELLEIYLGRSPTAEERARETIARVMALGFYAAAFIQPIATSGELACVAAAPMSIPEAMALLASQRERASPAIVAASLLEEMRRASETDAYEAAKQRLARG